MPCWSADGSELFFIQGDLLMSATLGDTSLFEETLNDLTGAQTVLVQSDQRPVPLEFDYSEIPLAEKIVELVEKDRAPVYLVHFSQRGCATSVGGARDGAGSSGSDPDADAGTQSGGSVCDGE